MSRTGVPASTRLRSPTTTKRGAPPAFHLPRSALLAAVAAAWLVLAVPCRGEAAVFVVDTFIDATDSAPGDGACMTDFGTCSLRAAIQEANALPGADVVLLGEGEYRLAIDGIDEEAGASGDLDVHDAITLTGVGASLTRIDADGIDRVLDLHAGTPGMPVVLEHLTLQHGALDRFSNLHEGAGLRVGADVRVRLLDVVVRENQALGFGATGIDTRGCIDGRYVRVLDNGLSGAKTHALSGGIAVRGDGSCLHLADSEISGNRGDVAGALYTFDRSVVTIRRSLVANNTARFSGAMELSMAESVLLENVTISGNRGDPGAILNDGMNRLTLVHCTVTGNGPASGFANVGGIHDVHGGFGRTFLSNTIVYGNGPGFLADDCNAATSLDGGNLIGADSRCRFSAGPTDRTGVDPDLSALADHGGFTRTHLPGPAAVDHAQADACTDTDQRGLPRPSDGDADGHAACDIGAIEVQDDGLFVDGFEAAVDPTIAGT